MKRKIRFVWIFAVAMLCAAVFSAIHQNGHLSLSQHYVHWATDWRKLEMKPTITTGKNRYKTLQSNLTLVTAYFNIGKLPLKGFDKEQYAKWAKAYRFVVNPLVVFTDDDDFYRDMVIIRKYFPKITAIQKIDKHILWPFQFIDKIKGVFSQPNYPRYPPNTVMPEYAAVQHAKCALVAFAIRNKILPNALYAWIDIGYFRHLLNDVKYYQLLPPVGLNKTKIAFNQVYEKEEKLSPDDIFRENRVWVGGGMFIGTDTVLLQFEMLYKRAFKYYLDQNLMNTDQQVLYSLYSEQGRKALNPQIDVQTYIPSNFNGDNWFFLGYSMRYLCVNGSIT